MRGAEGYRELWSDGRGTILAVVALAWFFALGSRLSLPVLLPHISVEFEIDVAFGGSIMALMFVGYALGQLPGGALGDRHGERNILVGSMAIMALGAIVIASLETLSGIVVGIFMMSVGCGMFAPARFTILSDIYAEREGTAHGIAMAAGDVGNTVLPVTAGILAATFYWRLGIAYAVPFLLILVVALARTIPQRTSVATGSPLISMTLLRAVKGELRRRSVFLVVCILFGLSIIFQGHTGLYPTYLIMEKGFSEELASVMLGVFFGSAVIVHLLAGTGSDRYGSKPVSATLLAVGTVAFASLPFATTLPEIVLLTVLSAAPIGVMTVTVPYLIALLSDDMQGTGFGLIRTLYIMLGALAPLVIGVLANAGHFDVGVVLLGATSGVALCIVLVISGR